MEVRTPQINPHVPEHALGDESAPPINGRTSCFILLRAAREYSTAPRVGLTVTVPQIVPNVTLNSGTTVPQLGYGVWQVPDDQARAAVSAALQVGYRSIDTAKIYDNEAGTGAAIAESGIPRGDVFLTTKLWNSDQGYDNALRAFDASLERLGTDYVDLYLIHWPVPELDEYVASFKALQRIQADGRAKAIGVSNFTVDNLKRLIDETGEVPALNQIELHPRFTQPELRAFHAEYGIATEAWSPLGQGTILEDATIGAIAQAHDVSAAQVILRWHLQLGNVVIPKSVTPARIAANFDVFGFELSTDEVERITALDASDGRIGPDPTTFNLR
ncbi:Probable oxidoreductase [Mycobacteroides abscessus subsp. abscessus]|nr:Probable oxidoreductase [Mycobacteroides abscessus subsp. abscessus]SHU23445.1 Probable oxidoreductase [Mycobacteroides abscessus subsp. abscessus]SHU95256.1 putative 2,5-diketo-D-gluconate reductase [Mycobacteroides abscessus subsp. abscessus]SHW10767.1 putative 2,5-diketo-D-gluconate reductase [Mycobacteroides abscessus subsp. abscessus]SHW82155.1 putative 2,5-diketo-D-gluconate reductase [Mycobacteroides abscessus subsp. abscessus]